MRSRLLMGILLPVLVLVTVSAIHQYRQAREAADVAYDRTLLASAKSIGETLEVTGPAESPKVIARVPYAALEAFEADNRSRMVYRVLGFAGETVSGYPDLAPHGGPDIGTGPGPYAALVDFGDGVYQDEPVRVAVLRQPVTGFLPATDDEPARVLGGMATIVVAETLELRAALARRALLDTAWTQALLLAVIALVVLVVVQRATRPVREISAGIEARDGSDLQPIDARDSPAELLPLIEAMNRAMDRLAGLLAHQKRFVRDASHQLRTPLAVLKAQLQSAERGDVEPGEALAEIAQTVDGATRLANQMLSMAKVEQLRNQDDAGSIDWAESLRTVAIDLSPLIAEKELDFELETAPAAVRAHDWALRELARNLMHNAIRHVPRHGRLGVRLVRVGGMATLTVSDSGPGLDTQQRQRLFQPFASTASRSAQVGGSGLGLAICHEIVSHLGGTIELRNRGTPETGVEGLDAIVRLPLVPPYCGTEPAGARAFERTTTDGAG